MTYLRTPASTLALGALVAIALGGATAQAGDAVDGAPITPATSRCAAFGPGFVDMGNGTCARIDNHVHVELGARHTSIPSWENGGTSSAELRSEGFEIVDLGTRRAAGEAWTTSGTSSAELRSEGLEMMPGVGTSHQLPVGAPRTDGNRSSDLSRGRRRTLGRRSRARAL